jgi:hypothetical protein
MSGTVGNVATAPIGNAMAALAIGSYLGFVTWEGNLGAFGAALKQDFLGDGQHRPFWRWALAVLFLVMFGEISAVKPYFPWVLLLVFAGMFLNLSGSNGGTSTGLSNLMNSLKTLYGYNTGTQPGTLA